MVNYKELVEFVVKNLVTQPDSVEVEYNESENRNIKKNSLMNEMSQ